MAQKDEILLTRKYRVLLHTTAWNRNWGGGETFKGGFRIKQDVLIAQVYSINQFVHFEFCVNTEDNI